MKITNECNMKLMARYEDNYFDLAIVDPPYGINIVTEFKKTTESSSSMMKGMNGISGGEWDNEIPSKEYFEELKRVSKNQIIWGGNYFLDYLNAKFKGNTIKLASQDLKRTWKMRQERLSPRYTTNINDIITVK